MAVSMGFLSNLERLGVIAKGRSFLDIGTSNFYSATSDEVAAFLQRHGCRASSELFAFAEKIAAGSQNGPDGVALNQSWVGQLLEAIGMDYDSIDIAVGYKTRIVDLNHETLPSDMVNAFDTVLNAGTTEHILNQYNSFRCIHEATKVGGVIVHALPMTGHTDHCYFTYTGRFFFDLAGYNEYEIIDFWIDGPDGYDNMYTGVRSYASVFPNLNRVIERIGSAERETRVDGIPIPNNGSFVAYRKVRDRPFMGAVETSTSWGLSGSQDVGADIRERYA